MRKMKKAAVAVIAVVTALIVAVSASFLGIFIYRKTNVGRYDFSYLFGSANRVVLFIGDGMGKNHINVTASYYGVTPYVTTLPVKGEITTYSNSLFTPTDSAAAGSALSTGQKYDNKEVARHNGQDVESISEYAKSLGLGVGIVTTDSLSGATPACFSSHANNRGDNEDIVAGQLNSNIDLFMGAGYSRYASYKRQFEEKGYTFASDLSELGEADGGKIIASFTNVPAENGSDRTPTLSSLVSFALAYMERRFADSGYFLMIEGAHIDKMSHDNDIINMVKYLKDFDGSVKLACDSLADKTDCAVIVTADHETGKLRFNNQSKEQINNSLYTRSGHSAANVPYYIYLDTTAQNVKPFPAKMDNTDIYKIIRAMLTHPAA